MDIKTFNKYILNLFLTIILFTFVSQDNFPQSISKEIKVGLELCYNFKWNQAEEIFLGIIKEQPEKTDGYHFLSGIYLWYYLGNRDKNDFTSFVKYSDKAIEIAQVELEEKPQNAYINYLLGSNYMYRAIAFTQGRKLFRCRLGE